MLSHWVALNLRVTGVYSLTGFIDSFDWPIGKILLLKGSVEKRTSMRVAEIGLSYHLAHQLWYRSKADWCVLCVEAQVTDWGILVVSSEKLSISTLHLLSYIKEGLDHSFGDAKLSVCYIVGRC